MLFEARGLTKRFGGLTAVSDVSFGIDEGEIIGIFGPNGSGKTTTLSLIAGMLAPTAGDLVWQGQGIVGRRPFEIAEMGIVKTFQNPQLFPELTVLDHMRIASHLGFKRALGARRLFTLVWPWAAADIESGADAKMKDMLHLCRLTEARNEKAAALSYGAEKMLGVAMAMMCDPKLLLLDEPASGLGQEEIVNLEAVLRDLRAHGVTLCIIDHKVGFLGRLADRSIALAHGAMIAQGATRDVLASDAVVEAYLGRKHA
ncbi:MAG: ABC transporter ATP-binding protein [Methylobacteriaceae bacterium]|nr:ABC transporter ATP-binding protein [Methylobacteriaceae bacterium]